MDTLLVLKDTIAVNIFKAADATKQCVHEVPTNENDRWIAIAICVAVFLVAIVLTYGFCSWQKAKFNHLKELEKQRNIDECAQKEKEYQREKERDELDYSRKDKELQHEKERIELDDDRKKRELQREKERSDWDQAKKDKEVSEALKQICDVAKDKEGKIDKEILELLLLHFRKSEEPEVNGDNNA